MGSVSIIFPTLILPIQNIFFVLNSDAGLRSIQRHNTRRKKTLSQAKKKAEQNALSNRNSCSNLACFRSISIQSDKRTFLIGRSCRLRFGITGLRQPYPSSVFASPAKKKKYSNSLRKKQREMRFAKRNAIICLLMQTAISGLRDPTIKSEPDLVRRMRFENFSTFKPGSYVA